MSESLASLHKEYVKTSPHTQAYNEIFWIMAHHLGISWPDLYIKRQSDFSSMALSQLRGDVIEYNKGKPIAYIIGTAPFFGLDLFVKEGVLIPRPDTESLVSAVIPLLREGDKIIEMGVGSGAISVALAMHKPNLQIKGIDSSETAINVAKKNIQKFGLENTIHIMQADWNDSLEACDYDLLIANPPYIAKGDKNLDALVEQYEPASALIAENNGLADLEKIIEIGCSILKSGGKIALEHGFMQQKDVANLLKQYGYKVVQLGSDDYHPRFVIATYG